MQPIRALERDEWERGRHLRLRALADAPDAFRSTYEAVSAESDAWWRDLVETFSSDPNRGIWVVESSGELVGMALGNIHQGTLHIFSMWVDPDRRGEGLGQGLLGTVMAWGRMSGATSVELWVTEGNEDAETLYARAGFASTGEREPRRHGSDLHVLKMIAPL